MRSFTRVGSEPGMVHQHRISWGGLGWEVLTAAYIQKRGGGSGIAGTTGYARTRNLSYPKVLPVNHGRVAIKLYPLGLRMYATNSDK